MTTARCFTTVLLLELVLLGCGKRGDPLPPRRRVPRPVTGFTVAQQGAQVTVDVTAPKVYTDGAVLPVLTIELLRAEGADPLEDTASPRRIRAAPGERLLEYDPLPPPGTVVRYAARVRAGRRVSALVVADALTVAEPPKAPTDVVAAVTETGVRLTWVPAPETDTASTPAFFVYRRPRTGRYARALTATPVADVPYDDDASPGEALCYTVRRVLATRPLIESHNAPEACLDVVDIRAPAPPQGVAAFARSEAVELSWSPSPEADLAVYRVYVKWGDDRRLVAEVQAPKTRHVDPLSDRRSRTYVVTAVDRVGNESAASLPVETQAP